MAKIMVCDICKRRGKLTETKRFIRYRGHRELRLDYCKDCLPEIPQSNIEYVKFALKILWDLDVTSEKARKILKGEATIF